MRLRSGVIGSRWRFWWIRNPTDPLGDLERLAEQGAAGIRIAPDGEFVNAGPYDMWKRTGELGLVVTCQGDPMQGLRRMLLRGFWTLVRIRMSSSNTWRVLPLPNRLGKATRAR